MAILANVYKVNDILEAKVSTIFDRTLCYT